MITMSMTAHAQEIRGLRLDYIKDKIGFGDVVLAEMERDGAMLKLTDTGVVLVTGEKDGEPVLITAYIATISQATKIFCRGTNKNSLPKWLYKTVTRLQRFQEAQPI